MKAKKYNKIVAAVYHAAFAVSEVITPGALLLVDIEKLAMPIIRLLAPKAYAPDIAIQAAFDVVSLLNDEEAIRQAFEDSEPGTITFFRVAVGHTFVENGVEDSDIRNHFVPMSKTQADQHGRYYDALDKHFEQLGELMGEQLEIIETVEVIEI